MTGQYVSCLGFAFLAGAFVLACFATRLALLHLRRHAILDVPNARSSHSIPTPRGGGLGVTPVVMAAWVVAAWLGNALHHAAPVLLGMGMLAFLCWLDDRRAAGLSPLVRILVQALSVAVGLAALGPETLVFQGWLPTALDRVATFLAWLWFLNLYNFMDGIDGLAGGETASIGLGVSVVVSLAGLPVALGWMGAAAAGAALGFLVWNWNPAKVFLGDVGSVPLGYGLGWLLIVMAGAGHWAPALILPLYYLADATCTLLRRLFRGARVWEAHREHFYQVAVAGGRSHAEVTTMILSVNALLVAAAAAAVHHALAALAFGSFGVALLMRRLAARRGTA